MGHTQSEGVTRFGERGVELRVAGGSNPSKIAGAIVRFMEEGNEVRLVAMGAGAVNQGVKAIAIARGMAAPAGIDLYMVPGFTDEMVSGVKKTAIRMLIKS